MHCVLFLTTMFVVASNTWAQEEFSRSEFASQMSKIELGMDSRQVENIVGRPDYIQTDSSNLLQACWAYGTNGKSGFPTLGVITFDENEKVIGVSGNGECAVSDGMDEKRLRDLLRILEEVPKLFDREGINSWNPSKLVDAVNSLHPLGQKEGLEVISEYLRVTDGHEAQSGMFLVLRALHEVPKETGSFPEIVHWNRQPKKLELLPRFPLLIVDDVPLLFVVGFTINGAFPSIENELKYFRQNGVWRDKPLTPSNETVKLLRDLRSSEKWFFREARNEFRDLWAEINATDALIKQLCLMEESDANEEE